jgi:putative tryptophan/tyrosine transport system substrate-binding protein
MLQQPGSISRTRRRPGAASLSLVCTLLTAGCSYGGHSGRPIVGVVQVSSVAQLDAAREGFYKALADSGFVRDVNITFIERNAQGDIPTLSLIMREFLQQGVTQVATMSSVATQTAMKVITDRPIVFGAVANPYVISAGTSPTAHRPNVTGAEIPLPVDSALSAAVSTFPAAKVWGTLFDPADITSASRSGRPNSSASASSPSRAPARRTSRRESRRSARREPAGSCRSRAS